MSSKLNYLLKAPRLIFTMQAGRSNHFTVRNQNKPDWFVNRPRIDYRAVAPEWRGYFLRTGSVPYEGAPVAHRPFVCTIGRAA